MPENSHNTNLVVGDEPGRKSTEESLEMVLGQLEERLPQQLSDKHIDRYFDTQQQLYGYIREDHKDERDLIKDGRSYAFKLAIVGGVVVILFLTVVAIADKAALDKFIGLFFAFLGGAGVGGGATKLFSDRSSGGGA